MDEKLIEKLRDLASVCGDFREFYVRAVDDDGVLQRITLAEYEAEMARVGAGDLQEYFEILRSAQNDGGKSAQSDNKDEKGGDTWA